MTTHMEAADATERLQRFEAEFVGLSEVCSLPATEQRAALVQKTRSGDIATMVENFKHGLIKRVSRYTDGDEQYSRDVDALLRNEFLALSKNMQERLRHFGRAAVSEGKVPDELYALFTNRKDAGYFAIELARLEKDPFDFFSRVSGIELLTQKQPTPPSKAIQPSIRGQISQFMLSKTKLVVLLGALVIAALLGLFPPWREKADIPYKLHFNKPLGYQFIGSPPTSSLVGAPRLSYLKDQTEIQIDFSRLLIEWVIVAAIMATLLFILHSRTTANDRSERVRDNQPQNLESKIRS